MRRRKKKIGLQVKRMSKRASHPFYSNSRPDWKGSGVLGYFLGHLIRAEVDRARVPMPPSSLSLSRAARVF